MANAAGGGVKPRDEGHSRGADLGGAVKETLDNMVVLRASWLRLRGTIVHKPCDASCLEECLDVSVPCYDVCVCVLLPS